jgi:hypothetical protein
MVEAAADVLGQGRIAHHLRPVEQQVIVIEHIVALLGLHIRGKHLAQLSDPSGAPGERHAQYVFD